jgi:hypothetical protein
LTVGLEITRVSLFPNIYAAGLYLESLSFIEATNDEREDFEGDGVEEDICVASGTYAYTGDSRCLHCDGCEKGREMGEEQRSQELRT